MPRWPYLVLLFCSLAFALQPVAQAAAKSGKVRSERLMLSSEYFQWREYLLDGSQLLQEKGTRIGIGVEKDNHGRIYPGVLYQLSGKTYFGRVRYDGLSQDEQGNFTPLASKTDYLGLSLVAMGGQRYGMLFPGHMLDLKAGLGLDLWLRRLLDGRDANDQAASGFNGTYQLSTVRVAAGLFHRQGKRYSYFQFELKYPLNIWERASNDSVNLLPGKDISWFARWDLERLWPFVNPAIGVSLYYENFRFKASDVVENVYQPKSRMDTVGIAIRF